MANEIFIARQDTLENVQATVNEIDANVDTANSTLGNFAGGGTDSVVTELNALKQAVAALTTKTDGLQENVTDIETVVNQIASGGSSSVIRRIQKDTFGMSGSSISIPLKGFTNLDKMIVIINAEAPNYNSNMVGGVYVNSFTINSLILRTTVGNQGAAGYYQVIEFY